MGTGPGLPSRKHPRLRDYDYSRNGVYFLTICTRNRAPILSEIVGRGLAPAEVRLLAAGRIAAEEMENLPKRFPGVRMEASVIMPNHIHLILAIDQSVGRMISAPTKSLSTIVGSMKRYTSKMVGFPLWQKSFHDHVIRNEADYLRVWDYIDTNPLKWREDCYYV